MFLFASGWYSEFGLELVLSPIFLLILAVVIFILAALHARTISRILLALYSLIIFWLFFRVKLWDVHSNVWDDVFFGSWYAIVLLDFALLPCLALWLWRRSHPLK